MLEIIIPEQHYEPYDEIKEEFLPRIDVKETKIRLEHSLLSISKWEEKWHKPFFTDFDKTQDEMIDYIRCMTLDHNIDPLVYYWIPKDMLDEIMKYIEDPMTATWFRDDGLIGAQKSSNEIVTAEIIYYWMISLSIPIDFQKWHLNKLLTLIKVIDRKNGKPKKIDKVTAAKQRAALNAKRRAQYNSKG